MLNPFFQQGSRNEQNLIQDLINEQLRIYGVEVYYLPRKYITEKTVIKEVIESEFDEAYPIEAYVENFEGYSDNTTILSKFGIQSTQEINLIISQERYSNYIKPLISKKSDIKLSSRPKEGDLIYFPLGDRLFEIKFVEHEKPFYQLQKNYVYELRCELFRYEDEIIDTSIIGIDDVLQGVESASGIGQGEDGEIYIGRTQTLTLVGVGSTATAIASVVNGGIRFITVTNRGGGYTSIPRVGISSAPAGGITGIASAIMIDGIVACNSNVNPSAKSVQEVQIVNAGSGYTSAPGVRFIGGGGSGAAATASIGNGVVRIITLTHSGSGYSNSPSITFTGISSVSAAATAVVSSAGSITSIRITNAGLGYTQSPTVTISGPNSSGIGTFRFNETVTGSISGVTATVRNWNVITNELKVSNVTGSFVSGETVVGSASSANYKIRSINDDVNVDGYADNNDIQSEADSIIDFTESNPFGMP
jgi:hypothetical protein